MVSATRVTLSSKIWRRPVDHAAQRVERGPIRLDASLHVTTEGQQVLEQPFDIRPQGADHADLVAGGHIAVDAGDVLIDSKQQLTQCGQCSRLVGGLDNLAGKAELGQEVGLDGERSLGRRAADVGKRVERIDVREQDRVEIKARGIAGGLQAVQHRLAEPPLHHRMDRGESLLDLGLDARIQLFHAALDRHREQRQHLVELRQMVGVQVARVRRAQRQRADDPVLIVERRDDLVADAVLDRVLLDLCPVGQCGEVSHDERPTRLDRSRVHRSREIRLPIVG